MGPIKDPCEDDVIYLTTNRWSIHSTESDFDVSDLLDPQGISRNRKEGVINTRVMETNTMDTSQELLWQAAHEGDMAEVITLLKARVDPNVLHPVNENSPLQAAVENGHVDVVKTIVNCEKCNPDFCDVMGRTALMMAAIFDDVDTMKILHKGGANLDARDASGKTALLLALQDGSKHSALYLIKHHCDVNVVDQLGQSALFLLLSSMDLSVVKLVKHLIKSGYDVTKDTTWLREEGMEVETVKKGKLTTKILDKLRARINHLHHQHRKLLAESSYGSKMIRIFETDK